MAGPMVEPGPGYALTLVLRSLRREDGAGLPVPRPELHLPTPEELGTEP